jgi:hypothetical protein
MTPALRFTSWASSEFTWQCRRECSESGAAASPLWMSELRRCPLDNLADVHRRRSGVVLLTGAGGKRGPVIPATPDHLRTGSQLTIRHCGIDRHLEALFSGQMRDA